VLWAGVDRGAAVEHARDRRRRCVDGHDFGRRAEVVHAAAGEIRVGVRRARDLPETEVVRVVLARRRIGEEGEIGLGLEDEHRHVDVGADDRVAGYADRAQRGLAERRAESAAAVDEVAVEDVRERMDAVHVRHHAERGLRFARGDDLLDLVVGERAGRAAHGGRGLREDVVRVRIRRVLQRAVACRIHLLERQADDVDEAGAAFDADVLRRHADPDVALADQLGVRERPVGAGLDAAAHVQPFDDDRAVELLRLLGAEDDDARLVPGGLGRGDRPFAVDAERADVRVRGRGALDEELLGDVADVRERKRGRLDERAAGAADRPFDLRGGDLGAGGCRDERGGEQGEDVGRADGHGDPPPPSISRLARRVQRKRGCHLTDGPSR
jgi:hypothetical protein